MDMNLKQQTIDTYNATAVAMAQKFNGLSARRMDIERGFSYFKKDNPSVLEIGCGNGRDAGEILKHTNHYLGIDISTTMIELARQSTPQGTFEVQDVESYEFPEHIDLIFAFASLLHSDAENIANVLEKASVALHQDGIFYISLKYGEGQKTKQDEFGTRTYFFYTPETLIALAGNSYSLIWQDVHVFLDQKWFTIVLQKK